VSLLRFNRNSRLSVGPAADGFFFAGAAANLRVLWIDARFERTHIPQTCWWMVHGRRQHEKFPHDIVIKLK